MGISALVCRPSGVPASWRVVTISGARPPRLCLYRPVFSQRGDLTMCNWSQGRPVSEVLSVTLGHMCPPPRTPAPSTVRPRVGTTMWPGLWGPGPALSGWGGGVGASEPRPGGSSAPFHGQRPRRR